MLEFKKDFRIHNRFDLEVRDVRTGEIRQRAQAENIILNALWTKLIAASSTDYFKCIRFGTGTGTLSAARTSLFTDLGYKNAGNGVFLNAISDGHVSYRQSIQLTETEYVGANLSEVGISSSSAASSLMTHAPLKDMNGNTVTIEKTDTDIITIYATVYLVMPLAGWETGGVKAYFQGMGGSSDDMCDLLCAYLLGVLALDHAYDKMFFSSGLAPCLSGAYNSNAGYSRTAVPITPTITYDVNNKRISVYARLPVASGNNADDINSIHLISAAPSSYGEQHLLAYADLTNADVYAGSTITGEALGTGNGSTKDFRTAFPRINAGAVVKVDGVAASGVTVDPIKPASTDITSFMRVLSYKPSGTRYEGRTYICLPGYNANANVMAAEVIFENTLYQAFGIDGLYFKKGKLYCSDDAVNWTDTSITESTSATYRTIAAGYKSKRYWKYVATDANYVALYGFTTTNSTPQNVHFETAPASGAVVTIDYTTPGAGKDLNHVFDFTFTLQLGEYVP